MPNENEPKEGLQETAEKFYDELTKAPGEQPPASSPETEQPNTQPEGGSDPLKTQGKAAEPEDKGFASHPKWIEREEKLKEAREALKTKDAEIERYSKLLDDPEIYAKWLKSQGYSDEKVQEALREKGFDTGAKQNGDKGNQAQAIAERACAKLGWDINKLDADQKAYIQDSVNLTMAIIQEAVGPMIENRVAPHEQMFSEMSMQKQFNADELAVQKLAKDEFPEADWEKVIKPAISKFLAELDEKDPKRTIKLTYEDIYYRATRPLLKELTQSKGRQEVRDTNKKNARPIGNGPATRTGEPAQKGRSAREEAEAYLDEKGIR